jgi:hypothetical protein
MKIKTNTKAIPFFQKVHVGLFGRNRKKHNLGSLTHLNLIAHKQDLDNMRIFFYEKKFNVIAIGTVQGKRVEFYIKNIK